MWANRRAQNTLEYAILIAIVAIGLLAMQNYVKRGFQGMLRERADDLGEQFSPGYTTYNYSITTNSTTNQTITDNGNLKTTTNITSSRTGNEVVKNLSEEYWGF